VEGGCQRRGGGGGGGGTEPGEVKGEEAESSDAAQ
jgi:hypothetical protein